MSSPGSFSTSLSRVSEALHDLDEQSVSEMAGLGLLVDWELAKFFRRIDWVLVRQSFTFKEDEVLMVVKIIADQTPYVVFISRPSPIGCMRTLIRKMNEGTLQLFPDKFA